VKKIAILAQEAYERELTLCHVIMMEFLVRHLFLYNVSSISALKRPVFQIRKQFSRAISRSKFALLTYVFFGFFLMWFSLPETLAAEPGPVVFKIQFEWGATSQEGYTYKGSAVAQFVPSAQWTGHIGVNYKAISGKGLDETSPASLYQGLGSLAAMRPDDLLQFYKAGYSATVTTDNNCSLTDKDADNPQTYTAWITRNKDGAVLEFGSLEAGDTEGKCDHYDSAAFTKDFAPGQDQVLKDFFTFHLTNEELRNFKTIRKVNTCSLDAVDPLPGKVWGKATLSAE
jgi:hypothetical protein